jgi:hypothetical protein
MQLMLMRHLSGNEELAFRPVVQLVGAVHNLHRSKHRITCFAKDDSCRMHVPNRECDHTAVRFLDKETPWHHWNGSARVRNLFVMEPKRAHVDAFVNINNEHVSHVLGSNNNVICACDGGSCMYMTCYTSKNTQKEDGEVYRNVAKYMVKKMTREAELAAANDDSDMDEDKDLAEQVRKGLSRLIGAVLLSTSSHVVAAPMAAFFVRHQDRFAFSHDFVFATTSAFRQPQYGTLTLGSVEGNMFMKSYVANYIMRRFS